MRKRVAYSKHPAYQRYKERKITICDDWYQSFTKFYEDMGQRPEGMTLDRIDNNKGYFKENCRWATPQQQQRNIGLSRKNKSGCKGVSLLSASNKWLATIGIDKKNIALGCFDNLSDAIAARRAAEKLYWR